ncbi:hypothetical protein QAD02_015499 [Eretmocerus hayati]|uniref:Uncharacterized protein n=1 Tax=Eretmocerus hayati TaxID=131215 RepID=A0ACC2P8F5_9HYME|nr:hypothetical protein QAD02_015499 [Eretmocerus hayati]
MFKRLTKARRHSADEAGSGGVCSTPPYQSKQSSQDDPNRSKNSDALAAGLQPSSFVFSPMTKFSPRRSCGDAYALLADDDTTDQPNSIPLQPVQQQKQQEADYRLVTAVPAFIVEHHEPEKQRGKFFLI